MTLNQKLVNGVIRKVVQQYMVQITIFLDLLIVRYLLIEFQTISFFFHNIYEYCFYHSGLTCVIGRLITSNSLFALQILLMLFVYLFPFYCSWNFLLWTKPLILTAQFILWMVTSHKKFYLFFSVKAW